MRRLGKKYQALWLATAVSGLGDGLLISGFALLAEETTGSGLLIALTHAISRIPWVFALALGSFVDRRDARTVLLQSDLFRAIVLGALGVLLVTRADLVTLPVLYVTVFFLNLGGVLFFCASQRSIPAVVEDHQLEAANSYHQSANVAGEQLIGPPLGGLLYFAGKGPIIGDAISFAGSAFLLATLPPIPPDHEPERLRDAVRVGWRWFVDSTPVRLMTVVVGCFSFAQALTLSTLVILGKRTLGLTGTQYGIMLSAVAVGNVIGGVIAPRVIPKLGIAALPVAAVGSGLAYLACVGNRSPFVISVALFLEGIAVLVGNVANASTRQRLVPAVLRGRVIGLSRSIIYGLQIPGAVLAGLLVRRFGTDAVFALGGALLITVGLIAARPLRHALANADPSPAR